MACIQNGTEETIHASQAKDWGTQATSNASETRYQKTSVASAAPLLLADTAAAVAT